MPKKFDFMKDRHLIRFLIAITVCTFSSFAFITYASAATSLSDAAGQLMAGSWVELHTENLDATIDDSGAVSHILVYSDGATWNPTTNEVLYIGGDHNGGPERFIGYSAVTNKWVVKTRATWMSTGVTQNHSYDYQAIDTGKQYYFYRNKRYKITEKSWDSITSSGLPYFGRGHCAYEYFPGIGLIAIGDGGVFILPDGANAWTEHSSTNTFSFAGLHPVAEYNPVHKVLIFGGGDYNDKLYKMDQNQTISALGSTPLSELSCSSKGTILTVDPVSGDYLVLDTDASFYQFDVVNDKWTLLDDSVQQFASHWRSLKTENVVATPIRNYGVTMFVKADGDRYKQNSEVWLYKHAKSTSNDGQDNTNDGQDTTNDGQDNTNDGQDTTNDGQDTTNDSQGSSTDDGQGVLPDGSSTAALYGECLSEPGLSGRSDIVMCESWEDQNWWENGYQDAARAPADTGDVGKTSIVSDGCISGDCLRVDMPVGSSKSLSLKWPLSNAGIAPEQLYMRYYIKLGPNWDPNSCNGGSIVGNGGKFPGLADVRINTDPSGQCGNGGDPGDGINCWSMRANFRNCHSGDGKACSSNPDAITRFGSYLYFYRQTEGDGSYTGTTGHWDDHYWGQFSGDGGTCGDNANNVYCGTGDAGVFQRDKWYLVEMFVKMNTPGEADGVIRGWVDGVAGFEKTNMIFRIPGHDNLHVRIAWLDVYKGGVYGNCTDSEIYLDQMVLATDQQIGAWTRSGNSPPAGDNNQKIKAPENLRIVEK